MVVFVWADPAVAERTYVTNGSTLQQTGERRVLLLDRHDIDDARLAAVAGPDFSGEDLAEIAVTSSIAAAPAFADFLLHGSGIPMGLAGGALLAVINRFTVDQTQKLIEELRRRVAALEGGAKLDRGGLERLEASAFYPAIAANAVSAPTKTELFADLLARRRLGRRAGGR